MILLKNYYINILDKGIIYLLKDKRFIIFNLILREAKHWICKE